MCPTSLPVKTFEKFYCPCNKWRILEITQAAYFYIFKFLFPSIIALVCLGQCCAKLLGIFFRVECWKFHGINLNMMHFRCVNDQRDAQFLWSVFIPQFFSMLYVFRTNLFVHHKEHGIIQQPDVPAYTNCTVQLIKCCSWWWTNDSPKHVEPFNEKIKTIHKNLCISLVYIHIALRQYLHLRKS